MSGDFRGAVHDATAALALHPFHTEALVNRALARAELGDLDGAAADYDATLKLDPKLAEAWAGRAMISTLRGRWGDAAADFERALSVARADWPHRQDTMRRLHEARSKASIR
jgi:Flp pilus assembly protein TadD